MRNFTLGSRDSDDGSPYYSASLYPGSASSSDASASSVPGGVDAGVSLALASLMPPTLPLLPPAAAAAAAAAAALMPYHPHVSASQATSSSMGVGSHMAALSARTQPPPPAARHLHCGPAHSPPAARPRVARTSAFTVEELLKDRRSPSADVSARPHFPVIVSSLYGARAPPSPPSGGERSPQRPPSATPARAAPPSLPPSPPVALAASTTPPCASPRRPDRPPASPGAPRGLDGLLRRPAAHAPPRSPPSPASPAPPSPGRRDDRLPSPLSRRPLPKSNFLPAGASPMGVRPPACSPPAPAPPAPAGSPRPPASPARPSPPPPPPQPSSPATSASGLPPPTSQAPTPTPTEYSRPALSVPISRLRESTLRKNPEPESLRLFVVAYDLVLATPATSLEPNRIDNLNTPHSITHYPASSSGSPSLFTCATRSTCHVSCNPNATLQRQKRPESTKHRLSSVPYSC
ncbi:vegetative cell wall protein gp1-like [Penaeus monodon]|uniref:vegetative cell wall protein gp1-like n=1 Tax=Penaeus monodon TaxID=6687 RepID=UPI0018A6DB00|nr:vegetative cell wall protein gp1-like [Penaeus monodon]